VDATLGGGGYARALMERIRPGGVLLGIDRDASALERFSREPVPPDVTLMLEHTNFAQLDRAAERGILHPNNAARRKSRLMKMVSKAAALAADPEAAAKAAAEAKAHAKGTGKAKTRK